MKRVFSLLVSLFLLSSILSSCSSTKSYNNGYIDGYSAGYSKASSETTYITKDYYDGYDSGHSDGFGEGYDDGYDDGYYNGFEDSFTEHGYSLLERAEQYAAENSQWHPIEAWDLINCYRNSEPFYADGSSPSKDDYEDAIDSLVCFYGYFCSAEFE